MGAALPKHTKHSEKIVAQEGESRPVGEHDHPEVGMGHDDLGVVPLGCEGVRGGHYATTVRQQHLP